MNFPSINESNQRMADTMRQMQESNRQSQMRYDNMVRESMMNAAADASRRHNEAIAQANAQTAMQMVEREQKEKLAKATKELNDKIKEAEKKSLEKSMELKDIIEKMSNSYSDELSKIKSNEEKFKNVILEHQTGLKDFIEKNKELMNSNENLLKVNEEISNYLVKSSAVYKNIILGLLLKIKKLTDSDNNDDKDIDKLLLQYADSLSLPLLIKKNEN